MNSIEGILPIQIYIKSNNMKFWVALEGLCELNFVEFLIQKEFPHVSIERDEVKFIKSRPRKNKAIAYLINYGGEGNIPFKLNEDYEKILESNAENILIACDVEKNLKRPRCRKKFILDRLEPKVDRNQISYVFSCPYLDEIYWDHPDDIMEVLKTMYQEKFPKQTLPNFIVPPRPRSQYEYRLKKLLTEHNLLFRKVQFSELFFSKFQYQSSNNGTVQRLLSFLQNI